ncbi:MAG: L-threonylcarbamoyladenylate synthase [Nitrospirota bacterium]|nr:L-threonylcarbamoyladenylate synthase [Nitrospirota bacterium]
MAKILCVSNSLSPEFFEEVRQCTSQNGVVAVATESSYALCASVQSQTAVSRVADLKSRPSDKPLLVLIGNWDQLDSLVTSIPSWAFSVLEHFWPGPLTCIFKCRPSLPEPLTMATGMIGVRCPGSSHLRSILSATGPLTGTSANRSGSPPLSTAKEVAKQFGREIDLILDSGSSPGGLPSTILVLSESPRILRKGLIATEEIQAVLAQQGISLADKATG